MCRKQRREIAPTIIIDTGMQDKNKQTKLKEVIEYKYLGVVMDKHYKWNKHVAVLIKKLGIWHRFFGIGNKLTDKMKKIVYSAMVRTLVEYGLDLYIDVN